MLYGSSTSSISKESRWFRNNNLYNHRNSTSDGPGLFLSSPSELSQAPQWMAPAIQEINVDDYEAAAKRGRILGQLPLTPSLEGTSGNPESGGSISFHSDSSESELTFMSCLSSYNNVSTHRSFLSKPIHPLSFPSQTPRETSNSIDAGTAEFEAATLQRDCWSSGSSSTDFADVSEPVESEICVQSGVSSGGSKCGLCERYLSQRSPWSSRRIMRSGDMPVAGVLSCRHVFHAECLEQTTPKACKSDPPCPLCVRLGETNSPDHRGFSRLRNSFPRLRPLSEDGQSRAWGCVQMGDCVERALHAPTRNTMLLLNRNRIKRNLSLKGNYSKEFPGKLRKSDSSSSQLFSGKGTEVGTVGSSKTMGGPSMKG